MDPDIVFKTEPSQDSKEIKEPRKRDITTNWTQHLRSNNLRRIECPECHDGIPDGNSLIVFRKHFAARHAEALDEKKTEEEKNQWIRLLLKEATSLSGGDRCASLSPLLFTPAHGL